MPPAAKSLDVYKFCKSWLGAIGVADTILSINTDNENTWRVSKGATCTFTLDDNDPSKIVIRGFQCTRDDHRYQQLLVILRFLLSYRFPTKTIECEEPNRGPTDDNAAEFFAQQIAHHINYTNTFTPITHPSNISDALTQYNVVIGEIDESVSKNCSSAASLSDVVHIAATNFRVLQSIGEVLLSTPIATTTARPRYEAALSELQQRIAASQTRCAATIYRIITQVSIPPWTNEPDGVLTTTPPASPPRLSDDEKLEEVLGQLKLSAKQLVDQAGGTDDETKTLKKQAIDAYKFNRKDLVLLRNDKTSELVAKLSAGNLPRT